MYVLILGTRKKGGPFAKLPRPMLISLIGNWRRMTYMPFFGEEKRQMQREEWSKDWCHPRASWRKKIPWVHNGKHISSSPCCVERKPRFSVIRWAAGSYYNISTTEGSTFDLDVIMCPKSLKQHHDKGHCSSSQHSHTRETGNVDKPFLSFMWWLIAVVKRIRSSCNQETSSQHIHEGVLD